MAPSNHAHLPICKDCSRDLPWSGISCCLCVLPIPNGFHPDCACKADPPAFQGIISPFSYAYPVDQLIKRFKEQGHLAAGKLVSLLLAEHLRSEPLKIDRLIPIPIHPFKRLRRGFNQCDLICKDLSQALAIPWSRRHLRSQRLTPSLKTLRASERGDAIAESFKFQGHVKGLRIGLVDDIVTTTATVREASNLLKRAGACSVTVFCLARATRHPLFQRDNSEP